MPRARAFRGYPTVIFCLEAIPLGKTLEILKKYKALDWDETLPPK